MKNLDSINQQIDQLQQERMMLLEKRKAFEQEIAMVDKAEAEMQAGYQKMREDIAKRHGFELGNVVKENLPDVNVDSAPILTS